MPAVTLVPLVFVAACGSHSSPGTPGTAGVTHYAVVYDANASTAGTVPVDPAQYVDGDLAVVLDNTGGLARSAYGFGGWNTAADGSGKTYVVGDRVAVRGRDVRLYARWYSRWDSAWFPNSDGRLDPLAIEYLGADEIVIAGTASERVVEGVEVPYALLGRAFLAVYDRAGTFRHITVLPDGFVGRKGMLRADAQGNVFVTGYVQAVDGVSTTNGFVAKYDRDLRLQWSSTLSGAQEVLAAASAVDGAGNVYVGGSSSAPFDGQIVTGVHFAFLAKFDATGERQWVRYVPANRFAAAHVFRSVFVGSEGSIYCAGSTESLTIGSASNAAGPDTPYTDWGDALFARFAPDGSQIWATLYGGASTEFVKGATLDDHDRLWVTGNTCSPTLYGQPADAPSASCAASYVLVVDSDGVLTTALAHDYAEFTLGEGMVFHGGHVYAVGTGTMPELGWGRIYVNQHAFDGTILHTDWITPGYYQTPEGITADPDGFLYVIGQGLGLVGDDYQMLLQRVKSP